MLSPKSIKDILMSVTCSVPSKIGPCKTWDTSKDCPCIIYQQFNVQGQVVPGSPGTLKDIPRQFLYYSPTVYCVQVQVVFTNSGTSQDSPCINHPQCAVSHIQVVPAGPGTLKDIPRQSLY